MNVGLREDLAAAAAASGWRAALLTIREHAPALFQYIGDERAGDWRFLLPALPRGTALCVGGALSPVPLALAETCARVRVIAPAVDLPFLAARAAQEHCPAVEGLAAGTPEAARALAAGADLVAVLRAAPEAPRGTGPVSAYAGAVAPGGQLYVEWDRPAALLPPSRARARLRRAGFRAVYCYWPKPGFAACELILPLGDRRLQRWYLGQIFFATTPARRALRRVLAALIPLGLFEATLPGYMIVAGRAREAVDARGA